MAAMARRLSSSITVLGLAVAGCGPDTLTSRPDPNGDTVVEGSCVPEGTTCPVEFLFPLSGARSVELRGDFAEGAWEVGVPMQVEGAAWRVEIDLPDAARVKYKFFVNGSEWAIDPYNPEREADGLGGENSVRTVSCGYTICPPEEVPPPVEGTFDWRSAVLYFVFVDRFHNGDPGNDFAVAGVEGPANYQGGDYAGVLARLEEGYFESLGVNALWLSVPMDNPNTAGQGTDGHLHTGYHGYWPVDLEAGEEHFGSDELLSQLVDAAHARGIKVLFDYAMNHVHADNPLFTQHPDWFWPLDYDGGSCVCGSPVCDWNDSYEQKRCWFTDYLPDWNFQNEAARDFSVENAMSWIARTGADGFRLDAVKHIELDWLLDLRARVAAEVEPATGEHFYMVGETFESGNRDIIKSFVGADRLDGQFDFPLRAVLVETVLRRSGTMHDLDSFLATNDGYYPGIMSTFIGNHDIARVIHNALDQPWGAWDKGDPWGAPPALPTSASPFERLAVAFTFLFTTKGIPLVYYGDEIGLPGAGDPDNRRFMQWDGLSDHQLSLREHIAKLGGIRRDHPALWRGARTTVSVESDTYVYSMRDAETGETIFVALNRGDSGATVAGLPKGRDLLTGAQIEGPGASIGARSSLVIVPE
jgi:glycosidase